jgi:hypothetical protein
LLDPIADLDEDQCRGDLVDARDGGDPNVQPLFFRAAAN